MLPKGLCNSFYIRQQLKLFQKMEKNVKSEKKKINDNFIA